MGTTMAALALSPAGRSILEATKARPGGVSTRPLGRTGQQLSIVGLGGWHFGLIEDEVEAFRIMDAAIDRGLTFFDNAWDYNDGGSEELMGRALSRNGLRKKAFLMTKNCERDFKGSMLNLEDSLRRLRTDYIDLWQFHEFNYDNDPDWVFEKGGIKAALRAQEQGKVRFIGFTGHKDPRIHLKMLNKPFDWTTAQMPINVLDAHYRSFQNEVVPICVDKGVSVLGMKSLGGGPTEGIIVENTNLTAPQCIRYALSLPITSLVVGIRSMEDLEQSLSIAIDFQPMHDNEKKKLLASVEAVATDGRYEVFKSTQNFDSDHHRRQHGFSVAIEPKTRAV